jgi:DedD protein
VTDSDNVELKKRSRRRLVGAAALALLAAIVLPMVMDQEPGSPAQDIQITIPDRDADSALARPIASRPTPNAEPQLAPPPEEQAPNSVPPPEAPRAASDITSSPPGNPQATTAPPDGAAKAGQPAPAIPTGNDAARAKAILEGKTAALSAGAAGETFVVQIGAFSDVGKAASIAADLKKRGFAAYTEKAGAMTRVRVGPFGGREEADRVAQRVRASGMSGSVLPR